jgi:hypothetical protein
VGVGDLEEASVSGVEAGGVGEVLGGEVLGGEVLGVGGVPAGVDACGGVEEASVSIRQHTSAGSAHGTPSCVAAGAGEGGSGGRGGGDCLSFLTAPSPYAASECGDMMSTVGHINNASYASGCSMSASPARPTRRDAPRTQRPQHEAHEEAHTAAHTAADAGADAPAHAPAHAGEHAEADAVARLTRRDAPCTQSAERHEGAAGRALLRGPFVPAVRRQLKRWPWEEEMLRLLKGRPSVVSWWIHTHTHTLTHSLTHASPGGVCGGVFGEGASEWSDCGAPLASTSGQLACSSCPLPWPPGRSRAGGVETASEIGEGGRRGAVDEGGMLRTEREACQGLASDVTRAQAQVQHVIGVRQGVRQEGCDGLPSVVTWFLRPGARDGRRHEGGGAVASSAAAVDAARGGTGGGGATSANIGSNIGSSRVLGQAWH